VVEKSEAERRLEADEFWAKLVYPEGATPEQIRAELQDFHFIMGECAKVYMHVTGGRISKPNTYAFEVISVADERVQDAVDEAMSDYRT
jgi:hypothetical protein